MGKLIDMLNIFKPSKTNDGTNVCDVSKTAPVPQQWEGPVDTITYPEGTGQCYIPSIFAVYPQVRLVIYKEDKTGCKRKSYFYHFSIDKKVAADKKWQTIVTSKKGFKSIKDCTEEARLLFFLEYLQGDKYLLVDRTKK